MKSRSTSERSRVSRQRALTIVAPVRPDVHVHALKSRLQAEGGWHGEGSGPFGGLETLHYLSCCVVESEGAEPALLVLELNFDGGPGEFLWDLVVSCRTEIDRIFSDCEGYPGPTAPPKRVVAFLKKRHQRASVFYLGHPGRRVRQIREEEALRRRLRGNLSDAPFTTRAELWRELQAQGPGGAPPKLPFRVRYSSKNRRGLKRCWEFVRVIALPAVMLAGIAAFSAFAHHAWSAGRPVVFGAAWGVPGIAALLVCVGVFRLRPRRLSIRGSWLALREALWQGLRALVYSAALVGACVALLPPIGAQWLPPGLWGAFGGGIVFGLCGLAVLALAILMLTLAYLLAGWVAAGLVGILAAALAAAFGNVFDLYLPAAVASVFVFYAGAAATAAAFYVPRLRRREREDAVAPMRWDRAHLASVTEYEDRHFQNHFANVTTIKDGLRLWQLRVVLRLIQLLATVHFNQGSLGSIPSIHFARFVILREKGRAKKRLLFLGNYDGAWPNYLGEFSHVPGVTLIWGNTELFPRPFLVGYDGARDEQRFKTWARNSQIKTLIWYSAYPELSVVQATRNTETRLSLARPLEDDAPAWGPLRSFWRCFRRPLDEVQLDEALRRLTN